MNICFLNYISRSGSTLLCSYLDANPEVFVTIEADLPREILRGETHSKKELLRIVRKISRGNKFRSWNLSVEEIYNAIDLPVANIDIWKQILRLYHRKQTKNQAKKTKVIVFKGFRTSIFEFGELAATYPEYKMLYVYRDPRAVYNSQSKTYHTRFNLPFIASPFGLADKWTASIKKMKRLDKTEKFKSVRYEDFVHYPQKILDDIFDYLGVKKIDYVDLDIEDYKQKIPDNQRGMHKLVGKELNENRISAWKQELDINSIKVIEDITGRQMKGCGYPLYAEDKFNVGFYYKLKVKVKQVILDYKYKFKRYYFSLLRKAGIS